MVTASESNSSSSTVDSHANQAHGYRQPSMWRQPSVYRQSSIFCASCRKDELRISAREVNGTDNSMRDPVEDSPWTGEEVGQETTGHWYLNFPRKCLSKFRWIQFFKGMITCFSSTRVMRVTPRVVMVMSTGRELLF